MGRKSQRKGRNGELELVRILNSHGLEVTAGIPVSFGSEPDITGLSGVHCEVKRTEKMNVSQAMKQAITDSQKFNDGVPAVFHRKNNEEWLVTMTLDAWLDLYTDWRRLHEEVS